MSNYYEILGVARNATAEDIKKKYRELALKYHPDRLSEATEEERKEAEAKFKECSEAYQTLSNTDRRRAYDMTGMSAFNFNENDAGMSEEMLFNFFQNIQNNFAQSQRGNIKTIPPDKIEDITLSPQEINEGASRKVKATLYYFCEQCHGFGCETCKGARYSEKEEELTFTVPAGLMHGSFVTALDGKNNPRKTRVLFNIDPKYKLTKEHDVATLFDVSYPKAVLGGTVTFKSYDGAELTVKIPAGVQPGMKIRLAGKGLYSMYTNKKGDLYLQVTLNTREALSDEERELLAKLNEIYENREKEKVNE